MLHLTINWYSEWYKKWCAVVALQKTKHIKKTTCLLHIYTKTILTINSFYFGGAMVYLTCCNPMIFIDRTKAVIQHFLEKSFK